MAQQRCEARHNLAKSLDWAIFGSLLAMVLCTPLSESAKSVFFVSALLFWIAEMAVTRNFQIQIPAIGWFFLAWLGVVFLSSLASDCGFVTGIRDVLMYTVFFFLVVNTVDSVNKTWALIWAIIVGIGLGDLLGFYDYFLSGRQTNRLHIGSLGFTGAYLAIIFSLLFGLWLNIRFSWKQQLLLIAIAVMSGIALIFTYTRSMWLIVLFIAVLGAVLNRRWWPVVAGLALVISLGMGMAMSPTIENRIIELATLWKDPSFASRFPIWEGSMRMFQENPFLGVGHKCFKPSREQYGVPKYGGQAHNLILHVAAELGGIGLMALIAWVGAYFHFLLRLRTMLLSDVARSLWFAAGGGVLTILIGGVVDPVIGSEVSLLFMLITGLLIASQERDVKQMRSVAGTEHTGLGGKRSNVTR